MNGIIKAEVQLTYEDQKKFVKNHIKQNKKKYRRLPTSTLLMSLIFPVVYLLRPFISRRLNWYDVGLAILAWVIILFLDYAVNQGRIEDSIYQYSEYQKNYTILFNDDGFIIEHSDNHTPKIKKYPYDKYVNATEQGNNFFLHAGKWKDYIIPTQCITEGTPEQLSALLREKLGDRYSN